MQLFYIIAKDNNMQQKKYEFINRQMKVYFYIGKDEVSFIANIVRDTEIENNEIGGSEEVLRTFNCTKQDCERSLEYFDWNDFERDFPNNRTIIRSNFVMIPLVNTGKKGTIINHALVKLLFSAYDKHSGFINFIYNKSKNYFKKKKKNY